MSSSVVAIYTFQNTSPFVEEREALLGDVPSRYTRKFLPRHEIRVIPKSNREREGEHEALDKFPRA
jgi:hypothetical protein